MSVPASRIVIRRILCPTDFSLISGKALRQAIPIAQWYGATLTALHVTPPWPEEVAAFPEYAEPMVLPTPADVTTVLRDFVRPAEERGVACEVAAAQGRVAPAIAGFAQQSGAELVVMGTHGHGGFERLVLGSVTDKVLRKSPCPVLTVGPGVTEDRPLAFARILCALDFSDASLQALDYAVSLARHSQAVLHVVHVVDWPAEALSSPKGFDLRDFRRHLADHALRSLSAALPESVRAQCAAEEITTFGKAHDSILRIAAEKRSDLLVLGVHGPGVVDRAVFGSTAYQVVRGARCPVLTVRA